MKLRVVLIPGGEKFQVYKPFKTVHFYELVFNYTKADQVYVIEESTGRCVARGKSQLIASREFNRVKMVKTIDEFRIAMAKYRKVPIIHELV